MGDRPPKAPQWVPLGTQCPSHPLEWAWGGCPRGPHGGFRARFGFMPPFLRESGFWGWEGGNHELNGGFE
jgi:hypothetical protein